MFKEGNPGPSRLEEFRHRGTGVVDGFHSTMEAMGAIIARPAIRTCTLVVRHPKNTIIYGFSSVLAFLSIYTVIGDDIREYVSPSKPPLALGAGEDDGSNMAVSASKLPLKSISLPVVDKQEAIDTSGWRTLRGRGFTLRYPNEAGWRAASNRIILGPDGDEVVKIEVTAKSLDGQSFEQYVAEQYANIQQYSSGRVTSQPANFPGWKEVGVRGEVLGYGASLRPGSEYYVRQFPAYINGMVYTVVASEKTSELTRYDQVVDEIVNSLAIAGTTGSATR